MKNCIVGLKVYRGCLVSEPTKTATLSLPVGTACATHGRSSTSECWRKNLQLLREPIPTLSAPWRRSGREVVQG
jgi:hypothetical protein